MSISNWEDAKKRSNYHFNNDIIDKNNIKHIGKFIGSWKKEVDEVINDAKKLNWSNRRVSTDRPNNHVQAEEKFGTPQMLESFLQSLKRESKKI